MHRLLKATWEGDTHLCRAESRCSIPTLAFPGLDCCRQRVASLAPQCHGQEQGLLCFTTTWSSDTRKEVAMHPPCLYDDVGPWKRNHNLVLWWGRETSKHTWCLGCGMRGTQGPLYQQLVMQ